MAEHFFTSDLHFFHHNIIKFCGRPYADVDHMNFSLIKNWNEVVGEEDVVWVLGDVSFGKPEETLEVLGELSGKIHLIPGNHDRKGKASQTPWEVRCNIYPAYHMERFSKNVKVVMCHFPFHSWERNWYNFHGHTHGTYASKYMQHDVGVDVNNYAPIHLDDVVKRARDKETKELY